MGDSPSTPKKDPIEKKQLQILKDREKFFQGNTKPALLDFYNQTQDFEFNSQYMMPDQALALSNVGQAFDNQMNQNQRQMDMMGTGDSPQAQASLNQLGQMKDQAMAGQVNQNQLQSILAANNITNQQNQNAVNEFGIKQQGVQALSALAPKATTATPAPIMKAGGTDWVSTGLGVAGGVLGGMFGGPTGAMAGAQAGSAVGGAF